MATIHIKDLALRTIIGIEDWEREKEQDILINLFLEYDATKAALSDDIKDAVDYKAVKQGIMHLVAVSRFNLVEKLAHEILSLALKDARVEKATVAIDKPQALRFARSVSLTLSRVKN